MTPRHLEYASRYFRRLEDIRERIAADNPTAASRRIERIRAAVMLLAAAPALGRPGRVAGTRELVVPDTPYIVPYRVKGDVVQIITIFQGAQRRPDIVLAGSGSSGQVDYAIQGPFIGAAHNFGAVRLWMGFPFTGPFDATNILVTKAQ